MEIRYYDHHIKEFIDELDLPTRTKVMKSLFLLESYGHLLGMPHAKFIERRIFELRIPGMKLIRLFYTHLNPDAVIVHVFVKKTQQIPKKELDLVRQRVKELLANV